MLAPHEIASKWDHEEHTEQPPREGDRRHLCEARYQTPEKERWEREDDARSEGRRGGANRLAHVGFEQTTLAVGLPPPNSETDNGQNRDGDRRRNREPYAKAEIGIRRPEEDSEDRSQNDRTNRDLGRRVRGAYIRRIVFARHLLICLGRKALLCGRLRVIHSLSCSVRTLIIS